MASAVLLLSAAAAGAYDITISSKATKKVKCAKDVCAPTGPNAILNVTDLENLIASSNVKVTTGQKGSQTGDIVIAAAFEWSNNSLTLDAYHSILFDAAVTAGRKVTGVTLITNDGGTNGALGFHGGDLTIQNLSTGLTINGAAYTLVDTVGGLAGAVSSNPGGLYAFVANYDASGDGTYSGSPVQTELTGFLEGLGNSISNLSVSFDGVDTNVGLFSSTGSAATIENLGLTNVYFDVTFGSNSAGALVGGNSGKINHCFSTGSITSDGENTGGLVGGNGGTVSNSYSSATVVGGGSDSGTGGLIGYNGGAVSSSFATGSVSNNYQYNTYEVGGLIGYDSSGTVSNSYATGAAMAYSGSPPAGDVGGLIGGDVDSTVSDSYSTGSITGGQSGGAGGFIGSDENHTYSDDYWDTTTSGTTCGAGNDCSDPNITGLTTKQLQSGLPDGFSDVIWAESPKINGGLPYLIANPPPKKK